MKRKINKIITLVKNPKSLLGLNILLATFSSLLFLVETSVVSKVTNIKEILGDTLNQYSLVSQNYDRQYKNFDFLLSGPKTSWLYNISLEIPEGELNSSLDFLKREGVTINYEKSILVTAKHRPHVFIWSCIAVFSFLGAGLYLFRSYKENQQYSPNINRYQPIQPKPEEVQENPLSFNDVAGIDEVKEQIEEIVKLFKDSSDIAEMGGKIPRGVLLNGPPGTGKTLLAKVTAAECGANFIAASGSEFVEMYVGVGARRVRDLFLKAKSMAPCIVFIDEIDAVATRRGFDNNSEREQTINQLLVEMDGFNTQDNILVIAATNQVEKLDPAILRPGRFDRQIMVHLPDINGREKILQIYVDKTKVDSSVSVKEVAKATAGFSGADLANLVNEAILCAARHNKKQISHADLIWAKDKIVMGSERKLQVSAKDKEQTAYHEIGHALVAKALKVGTVSGISIIPRGKALGVTQMEQDDVLTLSKDQAINQIAMMMGGRAAEKIYFNHLSTGAVNDLQRAHQLARSVIVTWGMSNLGPLATDENNYRFLSEEVKKQLDLEIIQMVSAAEKLAEDLLRTHDKLVKKLSNLLLEKENITLHEFAKLTKKLT